MRYVLPILLASAMPANADNKLADEYVAATRDMLSVTWFCQDSIGTAHYQFARTLALNDLSRRTGDPAKALAFIEAVNKSVRALKPVKTDSFACFSRMNELNYTLDSLRIKMR